MMAAGSPARVLVVVAAAAAGLCHPLLRQASSRSLLRPPQSWMTEGVGPLKQWSRFPQAALELLGATPASVVQLCIPVEGCAAGWLGPTAWAAQKHWHVCKRCYVVCLQLQGCDRHICTAAAMLQPSCCCWWPKSQVCYACITASDSVCVDLADVPLPRTHCKPVLAARAVHQRCGVVGWTLNIVPFMY